MTRVYCSNGSSIKHNEFYILSLDNNISEVVIGERILEREKEDTDSNWVADGPLNENDLIKIHSATGCA